MLTANTTKGRKLLLYKEDSRSETIRKVAFTRGRHIEALVVELPRGILTANTTKGLKGSNVLKSVIELLRRLQSIIYQGQ